MEGNEEYKNDPVEQHYLSIKEEADRAGSNDFGSSEKLEEFNRKAEDAQAKIQKDQEAGKPLSDKLQAWDRFLSEQREE